MLKGDKLFVIILLFALTGCNRGIKETAEQNGSDTVKITVANFLTNAPERINKAIVIEGTVSHTCKHGGKRMFLVDGNDSINVEITTGPDIVKFDDALVGSRVRVSGILKEERIDEKFLSEWENEIKKPQENHDVGVHTGTKGHMDQTDQDKLDQIAAYRQDLKAAGKDYLSFYSVEAVKLEELK